MCRAKRTLAIVALTTTLVGGCSSKTPPATTPMSSTILRLYATTVTFPLAVSLSTVYSETHAVAGFDLRSGSYQMVWERLTEGETPFFLSNHLPADSLLWAAPIGQDGIAIIVHPDVDVRNLTLDQLRAIYQGQIVRWDTLGGQSGSIVVISREEGSGTFAEFERLVMGRWQITLNARIAPSSQSMIDSVATWPGAVGYVSMGYLAAVQDGRVEQLSIDGVAPDGQTVASSQYPLRSTLFIVGLEEPSGDYRGLIDWIQGPEGQQVVARHYAPLPESVFQEEGTE